MAKREMKKLIKNLDRCEFDIDFDHASDRVLVQKKQGIYIFEFVVNYDKYVKDHREASYLQPEEGGVDFVVTGISDVAVYGMKNNGVELGDVELELLTEKIMEKICSY